MGEISLRSIYLLILLIDSQQFQEDLLTLIILSRLKAKLQKINFPYTKYFLMQWFDAHQTCIDIWFSFW